MTFVRSSSVLRQVLRTSGRQQRSASSCFAAPAPFRTSNLLRMLEPSCHHHAQRGGTGSISYARRALSNPAAANLQEMLLRERDEEIENGNTEMPPELADLKNKLTTEGGWKLVEGGTITKLYKTVDNKKIQLSFHCQDSVTNEQPYEGEEDGGGENEDGDEEKEDDGKYEDVPGFRFTVTSTKAGKSLILVGVSESSSLKIDSVAVSSEDPESIHDGKTVDTTGYQGPDFAELAEDLRDAFFTYAEDDLGLTNDMMAFISMYADYKEQNDYVKWLEDASGILA